MHRFYCAFSLTALLAAVVLTGCGPTDRIQPALSQEEVEPGEAKPIPPGEARPSPAVVSTDDEATTKTDLDTLPVLPTLTPASPEEKYQAALSRAFLLMAEKQDAEALEALKEAQGINESDFVKGEIERVRARVSRRETAQKAIDAIKDVIDAGQGDKAAKLAADGLLQFGDSDLADDFTRLKIQADALVSVSLKGNAKGDRFLAEAEAARKANNVRNALLAYDQAVEAGANVTEVKAAYDGLRSKLSAYDDNRAKAAEFRRDPYQLEQAVTVLKVAAESWDTPQVRQEISEAELAITNRRDRVAVADFEEINDIGVARAGHAIAEELLGHFLPRFDVVERSQVRAVLAEMKLEPQELAVSDTGRSEFGRIAKARYVVLGSVNRLSGIHVNARLVDTQTGLITQTARIVASTPEEMTNRLPALAKMLQMNDDEKRAYEQKLAQQARPVAPPPPTAVIPPPPPPPTEVVVAAPPPIVVYTPRPPAYGEVTVTDFNGFRVVEVGAPPPPPVVVVEAPVVVRDRAFFVAVELGDNCFRRGHFRDALRHFEFALSLNPGHTDIRFRVAQCRPLCPPPTVVVPILRPRMVVLPFAEFRDPYQIPSTIPPNLGIWTADALAPYFANQYDIVDKGELFWWMGRLGLTMRDVLTNPHARLCLGRALGARFFLMGSLREVASFDVSTHVIDAELNVQAFSARIHVRNAAELRFRLGELAGLSVMPPAQQVVVVQQQRVVQQKVVAAQVEFRKGNFAVSLGFYQEVLAVQPNHVEARQALIEIDLRRRRSGFEAAQLAAWQQQQAALQAERERQIAMVAAAQAAQEQARRDMKLYDEYQRQQLKNQQVLVQQQLLARAAAAQAQRNEAQRLALLESAAAIHRNQEAALAVAQARAAAVHQRREEIATYLTSQQQQHAAKVQAAVAADVQRKQGIQAALVKDAQTRALAEYDRFVELGNKARASGNFVLAAESYENARKIKPSAEINTMIAGVYTERAKAEAAAKGAEAKAKLDIALAQEKIKLQELEVKNAQLKIKYEEQMNKAKLAYQKQEFEAAVAAYQLALASMQTDEAIAALKQARVEAARAKATSDAAAKKLAEEKRVQILVDKRLEAGRTALAAKQADRAIVEFKAAVQLKPGDVEVQKLLTQAEALRDELRTTAPKVETVVKPVGKKTVPMDTKVDDLVARAQAALQAKDLDRATQFAGEAAKLAPTDPDVKKVQADIAQTRRQMASAEAEAKKKQTAYLESLRNASAALADKKYDAAIREAKEALAARPGDATAAKILGEAEKAKAAAGTAAMEAEKKQAAYLAAMQAGRTAYAAKKYAEAQEAFEAALKAKPGDSVASQSLDIVKKVMAKQDAAATEAKKAKDAYDAAMKAGRTALTAKEYDAAIKAFNDALKVDPGDPMATALLKQAKDAQAAMGADAKKKQLYEAWLDRAGKLMGVKRYDEAIEAYGNALKVIPGDPAATKGLQEARAAANRKDPPKKEPMPVEPKVPMKKEPPKVENNAAKVAALMRDAAADEKGGRYGEAYQTYQDVLKLAPANAEAKKRAMFCQWMDQGKRQLAGGKLADAAASFEQALRLDPNDAEAKQSLQQARVKKK